MCVSFTRERGERAVSVVLLMPSRLCFSLSFDQPFIAMHMRYDTIRTFGTPSHLLLSFAPQPNTKRRLGDRFHTCSDPRVVQGSNFHLLPFWRALRLHEGILLFRGDFCCKAHDLVERQVLLPTFPTTTTTTTRSCHHSRRSPQFLQAAQLSTCRLVSDLVAIKLMSLCEVLTGFSMVPTSEHLAP